MSLAESLQLCQYGRLELYSTVHVSEARSSPELVYWPDNVSHTPVWPRLLSVSGFHLC